MPSMDKVASEQMAMPENGSQVGVKTYLEIPLLQLL